MQVTTGTVIGGKVVVEGVPLVEGSLVTVLSREPVEPFILTSEDEEELLAAIAEIESGDFLPADQVIEGLRKFGWPWRFASEFRRAPQSTLRQRLIGGQNTGSLRLGPFAMTSAKVWRSSPSNPALAPLTPVLVSRVFVASWLVEFVTSSTTG